MREFQHKHIVRTLVYSRATIVILFLLMILLLRSIIDLNDKRIGVATLRQESEQKRVELEGRVKQAEQKTSTIHTERGFEEYVRTTYPVVKDGEGVIVVYDGGASPVVTVRKDINFWEKMIIWIKNLHNK